MFEGSKSYLEGPYHRNKDKVSSKATQGGLAPAVKQTSGLRSQTSADRRAFLGISPITLPKGSIDNCDW